MLQHLWRSLTEFRRRARPLRGNPGYGLAVYDYETIPYGGSGGLTVKIDGKTIKQNDDGELFVDLSAFGLAR